MYLTDWRFLITFLFLIFTNNENKILETIKTYKPIYYMDQIKCIENVHVAYDKEFVLVNWQIEFNWSK